jgi:hypothetical protein
MFFICFASFNKNYRPAREKNKQRGKIHANILKLYITIKMLHINDKGLESTNGFDVLSGTE